MNNLQSKNQQYGYQTLVWYQIEKTLHSPNYMPFIDTSNIQVSKTLNGRKLSGGLHIIEVIHILLLFGGAATSRGRRIDAKEAHQNRQSTNDAQRRWHLPTHWIYCRCNGNLNIEPRGCGSWRRQQHRFRPQVITQHIVQQPCNAKDPKANINNRERMSTKKFNEDQE